MLSRARQVDARGTTVCDVALPGFTTTDVHFAGLPAMHIDDGRTTRAEVVRAVLPGDRFESVLDVLEPIEAVVETGEGICFVEVANLGTQPRLNWKEEAVYPLAHPWRRRLQSGNARAG